MITIKDPRFRACKLAYAVLMALGVSMVAVQSNAGTRPNIVVIYADDLGYTDLGVMGSRYYESPNIDKLAADGMLFTQAHANSPNCAPARGALYSGEYCGRTGMYNVADSERGEARTRSLVPPPNHGDLSTDLRTFGNALTDLGYNCVQLGKWHLGYSKDTIPPARGFEAKWTSGPWKGLYMSEIVSHPSLWAHFHYGPATSAKTPDGAFEIIFGDWNDPRNNHEDGFKVVDEKLVPKGTYLSDYLDSLVPPMLSDLKSQDKPFLLMLNHYLVHGPYNAPEEEIALFEKKTPDGKHNSPVYAAMIKKLDDSVGRMMEQLKKQGLLDNTVVIFYSDNGGVGGYRDLGIDTAGEITGNDPLKGGKTELYDGGIRVPLIISYPGHIQPGQTCDEPVIGIDFFPTFLELAGSSKAAFQKDHDQVLDGLSMGPLLKQPEDQLPRDYLAFHFPAYCPGYFGKGETRAYWRSTPHGVLKTRQYKLVEHYVGEAIPGDGSRLELYDIASDVGETTNIAAEHPELVETLYRQLCEWRAQTGARLPVSKDLRENSQLKADNLILTTLTPALRDLLDYPQDAPGVLILDAQNAKGEKKSAFKSSMIIKSINDTPAASLEAVKALWLKHQGRKINIEYVIGGKLKNTFMTPKAPAEPYTLNPKSFNDWQPYTLGEYHSYSVQP